MATREELRTAKINDGWVVQPVAQWRKVGQVENVTKYDANVVSPAGVVGTAQVLVTDEGRPGEVAVAQGMWTDAVARFRDDLIAYIATMEALPTVWAIRVDNVVESEEIATVTAWVESASDVVETPYVVRRRNGTFQHKKLISV